MFASRVPENESPSDFPSESLLSFHGRDANCERCKAILGVAVRSGIEHIDAAT